VTTGKDIKQIFGENLRRFRTQQRLSQRALDALSGIDHGMISRMENGQVNVTLNTLAILAAALQILPYQLILEEVDNCLDSTMINEEVL
jgi:transcriptional regulator with XRE-family HTH domain